MNRQACTPGSYQNQPSQDYCDDCPAGRFQREEQKANCVPCPPGYFCTKGSTSPIPCGSVGLWCGGNATTVTPVRAGFYSTPELDEASKRTGESICEAGSVCIGGEKKTCTGSDYADEEGLGSCKAAPAGHTTNSQNTGLEKCPRGKFSSGGYACEDCEEGQFSNVEGASFCTPASICPPGSKVSNFNNNTHDTTCEPCGLSEVSMGGLGTSCAKCQGDGGEYANEGGLYACKVAPAGFSVTNDRTNITVCASGKYSSGGQTSCSSCELGKYSGDGAVGCTPCEPGEVPAGQACTPCEPGEFASFGSEECSACPKGFFTSNDKSGYCEPCAEGTFTTDHISCTKCPAGKVSGVAQEECQDCERGKFAEGEGNTGCTFCDDDKVLQGSTTRSEGSTSVRDCLCEPGELDLGSKTCETAFDGVEEELEGMTVKNMTLMAGYWRTSANSTEVLACLSKTHCRGGSDVQKQCAVGHTGPLCAVCQEGYASAGTGANMECVVCDGSAATSILVYLGIFFSVVGAAVAGSCCCGRRKRRKRGEEDGEDGEDGVDGGESMEEGGFSVATSSSTVRSTKSKKSKHIRANKYANKADSVMSAAQNSGPIMKMILSYLQIASGLR